MLFAVAELLVSLMAVRRIAAGHSVLPLSFSFLTLMGTLTFPAAEQCLFKNIGGLVVGRAGKIQTFSPTLPLHFTGEVKKCQLCLHFPHQTHFDKLWFRNEGTSEILNISLDRRCLTFLRTDVLRTLSLIFTRGQKSKIWSEL